MATKSDNTDFVFGCLTLVAVAFVPILLIASAWMESRTYNRLTGANTTTWDALWVELRVQGETK